jgi:hypothetical protein
MLGERHLRDSLDGDPSKGMMNLVLEIWLLTIYFIGVDSINDQII